MMRAFRRRAPHPKRIGRGGAFGRAALAMLLNAAFGLHAAMGAGTDPNRPVSSRDAPLTEAPAVSEGIAGVVVDEAGAPIPDVFVQVAPADPAAGPVPEIAIMTDDRGRYQWPLPPGRYVVSIAPAGVAPQSKEVVVEPGRLGDLNFVIERRR
jgi:Carboxypeptidase regulatory-like domain